MTVKAPGTCTRYQVRVAAVDADGATASTGTYRIAPLVPAESAISTSTAVQTAPGRSYLGTARVTRVWAA